MAFRGLLYTDCRAEESLRGGTGFQFQAATLDAQPGDESLMTNDLMYQPAPHLMIREAPVSDYPPSFAYSRTADTFGIAQGKYLGTVYGDNRQGNQITHALFTDDDGDLGTTRPAQLFGADVWRDQKVPTKQLEQADPPLSYRDEFDLPALHALAKAVPDPAAFLAKVVSACEHAAGDNWVKTIISGSDSLRVMQWIALGTLLLPTETALTLSVRAFAPEPLSAPQRIVAMYPPAFDRAPNIVLQQGISGIDIDTHTTGSIAVTERARFWAHQFVTADPYEVIDAMELAGRLPASEPANRTVATVLGSGAPLTSTAEVNAVGEVLVKLDADDFEEFAETLVEALESVQQHDDLTLTPFTQALAAIDNHAGTSLMLDRMQTNVLVRSAAQSAVARQLLKEPRKWRWSEPQTSDSTAARSLAALLDTLDDADLPAAFEFAAVTGVPVTPNGPAAALQRLAAHWARNPDLSSTFRSWLFADHVLDLLVDHLDAQCGAGASPALAADIDAGKWDWLLDIEWIVRGGNLIGAEIANRSIPNAEPKRQRHLVKLIAHVRGPGSWKGLWRGRTASIVEVIAWLSVHPGDINDPRFVQAAGPGVEAELRTPGRLRPDLLRLIHDLHRVAPGALPRAVAAVAQQNQDTTAELRALRDRTHTRRVGHRLASKDRAIVEIRLSDIVTALVDHAEVSELADFLKSSQVDPSRDLQRALMDMAGRYPADAVIRVFDLSGIKLPKSIDRVLKSFPLEWYEAASTDDRERVAAELADWPEWRDLETEYERKHESAIKKVGRFFGSRDKER